MDDETFLGVTKHRKLLEFVLNVFKKDLSNVLAVVGDNVQMSKAL